MSTWPPINLIHAALAKLDRGMLTSPDGKTVEVKLEAIRLLLVQLPLMLKPLPPLEK